MDRNPQAASRMLASTFAMLLACTSGGSATAGAPAAAGDRAVIAGALRATDPGLADVVSNPASRVVAVDAPMLRRHRVHRVDFDAAGKPVLFYVAAGQGGQVVRLTANPQAFGEMVRQEGLKVESEAEAVALARLWFETTRVTGRRNLLVESFDAIPFRTGLEADEAKVVADARERLGKAVGPVSATRTAKGFEVMLWQVREDDLDRLRLEIAPDGAATVTHETVAPALPLAYVL